jgi:tetratricopeptide (TPR) repeat protein
LAGNAKNYENAIKEGLNFAWEGEWEKALKAYKRAQSEMPDDPEVHSHLGLTYLELERFESALRAYSQASRLAPNDPAPLKRIAEIHERLGQPHAAAAAHFSIGDIRRRQRSWAQAIQSLQRSIQIDADNLRARLALAEVYAELDQPLRAAKEHLNLARAWQRQGEMDRAIDECTRALELDPRNAEARALGESLRLGEAMDGIQATPMPAEDGQSPADLAREKALEELAGIPFEDVAVGPAADISAFEPGAGPEVPVKPTLNRPQIDALIAQAIDFQTRGLIDEAITCYNKVIDAGVDRSAAHFNLGLLYQQRLRFEPAIFELKKAVGQSQYALGSHFALGECYRALGRLDDALEHFVEVLKIVDLGTVQRDQADDLMQLYDALSESYVAKGDSAKALEFTNSLVEFLTSKGWEDKARDARRRLDGMADDGVTMSLAEMLAESSADAILSSVSLSQEYMRRGALTAATEVCYRALESAPTYLPLHLRLAEIFVEDSRVEDAVTKYRAVADLYLVREEARLAINVYKRMLKLTPLDVVVRSRLIDLLLSFGEIDQALEQYMALADAYYQLAQVGKSLEKYAEALRLVLRSSDEKKWRARLLRSMAELQTRRAKWREAIELYQQILAEVPDDERAWLNLIDLSYKVGGDSEADKAVVTMVKDYYSRNQKERALVLLQEAVRIHPQQMALRARLARIYIEAGRREEAIAELDMLRELQLAAGLKAQAKATVRYIITLKPQKADAYEHLLSEL